MDDRFRYILVIPDLPLDEFTPTAGFSPALLNFEWAPHKIATLPADVWEPALSSIARVNRRARGQAGYAWLPLNLPALQQVPAEVLGFLLVLFTNDDATGVAVEAWCEACAVRPLHISAKPTGRALAPHHLNRRRLREFAEVCLQGAKDPERGDLLRAIRKWPAQQFKRSTLRYESHNTTLANEMVLLTEGLSPSQARPLDPSNDQDYVRSIRDSTQAVRRLRACIGDVPAGSAYPLYPDLILFAPAMYRGLYRSTRPAPDAPFGLRETFQMIQRQTGYAFQVEKAGDAAVIGSPAWVAVHQLRSQELRIQSAGVGLMAASTISAAIRLPARVNRIAGVISALANHLRAHPDAQPKTRRIFRAVQDALANAIDPSLVDLIRTAQTGVRIVADAPVEWLSVSGLPLMLTHQTSRTCATPGNLSFGELVNSPPILLDPAVFGEILHIRSFSADDPIREHMEIALATVAPDAEVTVRRVDVQSREEMVAALNEFSGALAIFDTHGVHEDGDPGGLSIGRDKVDAWSLRGEARIPPIVILSACDTHAVDGSHATVANGLITCGARSVLATFLPVRSMDSSVLVARLVLRAKRFVEILNRYGQSVSWARVITYGLRAQLVTDVMQCLRTELGLPFGESIAMTETASARVNLGQDDWWSGLRSDVAARTQWTEDRLAAFLEQVIAGSDVIRYVHVGSPESIILSSQQIFDELAQRRPPSRSHRDGSVPRSGSRTERRPHNQ